jgi:hypothetical protein
MAQARRLGPFQTQDVENWGRNFFFGGNLLVKMMQSSYAFLFFHQLLLSTIMCGPTKSGVNADPQKQSCALHKCMCILYYWTWRIIWSQIQTYRLG